MTPMRLTLAAAAAGAAAAAALAAAPALADHHIATAAVTAEAEAYNAAVAAMDVDAMLGYYADDVVVAPPDAPSFSGADALADMLAGLASSGAQVDLELVNVKATDEDGPVYVSSTATAVMTGEDGASMTFGGTNLQIWELQDDGSWKIAFAIWTQYPLE